MKLCSLCQKRLPASAFHRDANRPDGRYPRCRACRKAREGTGRRRRSAVSIGVMTAPMVGVPAINPAPLRWVA